MASPLTLENRLLLACARTEHDSQRIQALVESSPNWQEILRKAEHWGLGSLVYTNLQQTGQGERMPKSVMERLRSLFHRDSIHGIARRKLLHLTLLQFAEANIPVIVLKGLALATVVYPLPALRPSGDVDLLVQRHDMDRVEKVLRRLQAAPPDIPSLGPKALSLLDVRHDLFSPQSFADGRPVADLMPIEDFLKRVRCVQITSLDALVFSPEDLLLHLAFHLTFATGFIGQLRTLCDIGEVSRCYKAEINWHQLVARAHTYHMGKPLYYALRLAREFVEAGVPPGVLQELRAGFGQLPLEEQLITAVAQQALLSDAPGTLPSAKLLRLSMRLLTTCRARDVLTVVYRHLTQARQPRVRQLDTHSNPQILPDASTGDSESAARIQPVTVQSTFPGKRSAPTPGEIAVTYDQNAWDGLGAQLQRIYALYALSRALGTKYVHSPITHVDYQGLIPLLTGCTDPDFTSRCSAFFALPSDDFDIDGCERITLTSLSKQKIEHYRRYVTVTGRSVLLRAHEAYGYTDRHPEAYRLLRTVSPYRNFRPEGPIRISIHMRRGDRVLSQDPRQLPNAYYLRVCGTVVNALQQQRVPFVVRLHTEIPQQAHTVHPGHVGLFIELNKPATIDPVAHALNEFEALPNLEMVLNVDPQEALADFATADILILSLSSFGYMGGLLNPHGLVIAGPDLPWPRNFHSPLPDWLVADEEGNLDVTQLVTRITSLLRCRGL